MVHDAVAVGLATGGGNRIAATLLGRILLTVDHNKEALDSFMKVSVARRFVDLIFDYVQQDRLTLPRTELCMHNISFKGITVISDILPSLADVGCGPRECL